jgi:hypothetical protein
MAMHKVLPFWCRTDPYQADPSVPVEGILYRAVEQTGPDEYICEGSRKIGKMIDGTTVWLVGGYTDAMNSVGIKEIQQHDIKELSRSEKLSVLHEIKYELDDVDSYDAYTDNKSIWFSKKPRTQTQRREDTRTRTRNTRGKTSVRRQTAKRNMSHLNSIHELTTPYKSRHMGGYRRKSRKNRKY